MKKLKETKLDFLTINLTREGLSAISDLIQASPYLNQILDGKNHFTENCEWTFDELNNRNAYRLHLPKNKLEILNFLFASELEKRATKSYWDFTFEGNLSDGRQNWSEPHFQSKIGEKMLKRILKAIKNLEVK